jgi:hypothetical protein
MANRIPCRMAIVLLDLPVQSLIQYEKRGGGSSLRGILFLREYR